MLLSQLIFFTFLVGIPLLFVAAVISSFFIPARFWVWLVSLTLALQFHIIPVGGVYPSVALLAGLAAWRFTPELRDVWRSPWIVCFLALAAWKIISIAWSPNQIMVVRNLIYALPFIFVFAAARHYAKSDIKGAMRALTCALYIVAVQSVLVIACRISPGFEFSFLMSPAARVFISANVIAEQSFSPNNVFSAAKAGGVFVNGNIAAAFGGACAMLAWGIGRSQRNRLLIATAVLHWVSVFFTGSKAGGLVAVLLPIFVVIFQYVGLRRIMPHSVVVFCLFSAIILAMLPIILPLYQGSGFTEDSLSTLQTRQIIWDFALKQFSLHPLLGLGSGGWENAFVYYAAAAGFRWLYPPHNAYLILWSEAGLPAAALGLAFTFFFFQWCWNAVRALQSSERSAAIGLLASFAWVVIQAQGENFGIFGEAHITPLLALAAGIVSARWDAAIAPASTAAGHT